MALSDRHRSSVSRWSGKDRSGALPFVVRDDIPLLRDCCGFGGSASLSESLEPESLDEDDELSLRIPIPFLCNKKYY